MSAMIIQLRPRPHRSVRTRPGPRSRDHARGPVWGQVPGRGLARRSVRRLTAAVRARRSWLQTVPGGDRGDVPGWVLVTMMTAGLVFVLWGLAGQELQNLFTSSLSKVSGKL